MADLRKPILPIAVATAAITLATIVLASMGRHLWCSCGSPVPWAFDVWSKHNSQHIIDPYAFTHVLHGVAFYAGLWWIAARRAPVPVIWRGVITAVLESGWEILENSPIIINRYRAATISLDYFGDSIANSLADVGACLFGFWIASKLPWRASLVLFVVTELVLLMWVRDSLLVNILQLVYPIEAVKNWQMAP